MASGWRWKAHHIWRCVGQCDATTSTQSHLVHCQCFARFSHFGHWWHWFGRCGIAILTVRCFRFAGKFEELRSCDRSLSPSISFVRSLSRPSMHRQVCSAVQNQDFTVIQDYITGLKALLYLKSNPPQNQPQNWDGQSPPIFKNQKGKPVAALKDENGLPLVNFGVQKQQRDEETSQQYKANGPFWKLDTTIDNGVTSAVTNNATKPAPSVKDITGISLPYIGAYKKLDNVKQVVALIDDVSEYYYYYCALWLAFCSLNSCKTWIWNLINVINQQFGYYSRICASTAVNVIWLVRTLAIRPSNSIQKLIGRTWPTIALAAICAYPFVQSSTVLGNPLDFTIHNPHVCKKLLLTLYYSFILALAAWCRRRFHTWSSVAQRSNWMYTLYHHPNETSMRTQPVACTPRT